MAIEQPQMPPEPAPEVTTVPIAIHTAITWDYVSSTGRIQQVQIPAGRYTGYLHENGNRTAMVVYPAFPPEVGENNVALYDSEYEIVSPMVLLAEASDE